MQLHPGKACAAAILAIALPLFAAEPQIPGLDALRQAAEQGNPDAQYELGILYEFGFNFADNKPAAYGWYSRAAEQGNAAAARRRDAIKSQLSAAEIDRAQAAMKAAPPNPTSTSAATN